MSKTGLDSMATGDADTLTPGEVPSARFAPVGPCDACLMGECRKCTGVGCYHCPGDHYSYGVSMCADQPRVPGRNVRKKGHGR